MKQYDIITHHTIEGLKSEVNIKINAGWEVHGNLVVTFDSERKIFIFLQRIIKQ